MVKKITAKKVLFHQVSLRSQFVINGMTYVKFSPRKGMTADGKVISVADAIYVELAS